MALHCEIPAFTKWDRKNYYYPDLPKGYQISQYDLPMSCDGYLDIRDPKGRFPDRRVRIIRAHLEEDARHGASGRFKLPHDKRTLAAHLGMTPENLSRNIAQIADHGATFGRRDVTIVDRDKLTRFAQPSPSLDDDRY